jgi:hypothetical protein
MRFILFSLILFSRYFDQLEREEFLFELNRDNVNNKCQIEQINNDIKLLNIDRSDYKKWLLTPELSNPNIQNDKDVTKSIIYTIQEDVNNNDNNIVPCNLIEDLNYEIINYNDELDNMDIITDFELDDVDQDQNKSNAKNKMSSSLSITSSSSSASSSSSLFNDITSKPLDHWLLK